MYRFQNTTASFVRKPTSARWANQIISTNDPNYYRNSFDQQIGSSSSNIFRRICFKRDRKVYPFPKRPNQSNMPIDKFLLKTIDIKACIILFAVFHVITVLTISSTSVFLLLDKGKVTEIPVGTILLYSGNLSTLNSATYRWLLCDGSEVSRSTYSDLFNVIGTTYGSGNSTDIFNLPDFRGRFPLGGNSSDTSQLVPGGNAFHVITVDEMPSHAHDTGTLEILINGAHTHSVTDPGHNHGGSTGSGGFDGGYGYAYAYNNFLASTYGTHAHSIPTGATGITIVSDGSHTHGIQGITGFNGSNQAIDMMPPYQTIHFIIRT